MSRRIGFCMQPGMFGVVLGVFAWLSLTLNTSVAMEQTIESLEIGTHTYKNVTVTTKTPNYVFILHSQGMTNLKVTELPPDAREKLGYPNSDTTKTNGASAWAKQTIAKIDSRPVKAASEQFKTTLNSSLARANVPMPEITTTLLIEVGAVLLLSYLFHSFCCMLICKKAGSAPGVLVWLPGLQIFPMLRAARMSGWWFFAFLVPVLNLIASVLWCFKIADARGKTGFVGFLLAFPLTSFLTFLYLAFSNGTSSSDQESSPRKQGAGMMTLEAV